MESEVSAMGGGGDRDIFNSDGGTRMDDRAALTSVLEEQEQGQEERTKFRCEMPAERY